jgi:ribosomal protein S4
MKQVSVNEGLPTANIAINKSRVKIYDKKADIPTVYLKKGQEFQIELFNPTTDNILCEIHLNNKQIAQGGLVLKPGQRVFLERYLDVAQKFKFDTYEVSNTSEVKKAIEENGDFKVHFFKEDSYVPTPNPIKLWTSGDYLGGPIYGNLTNTGGYVGSTTTGSIRCSSNNIDDTIKLASFNCSADDIPVAASAGACMDSLNDEQTEPIRQKRRVRKNLKSKKIETGRVEKGSYSDQEFTTVNKKWYPFAFHTVEYKLLPESQKVNTVKDVVKGRYCTTCGSKPKKNDNFCGNCGTRI